MKKSTLFVGLDEAKDSIAVAIAEPGRQPIYPDRQED
jgi:hypothetical protein